MLSFLEDLNKAVQECCKPEKPFEERSQHDRANNSSVDNLSSKFVSVDYPANLSAPLLRHCTV
jgi:hypothetical protein